MSVETETEQTLECDFCKETFTAKIGSRGRNSAIAQLNRHIRELHDSDTIKPEDFDRLETPPTILSKIRTRFLPNTQDIETPRRPKRQARKQRNRQDLSTVISMGVNGLGWIVGRADPPVGQAVKLEAIGAGPIIDRLVAGTLFDKILQPIIGDSERWKDLGILFALPGTVWWIERHPDQAKDFDPYLRELVLQNAVSMARAIKNQRVKAKERMEAIKILETELLDDLPQEMKGVDPVGAILYQIFSAGKGTNNGAARQPTEEHEPVSV